MNRAEHLKLFYGTLSNLAHRCGGPVALADVNLRQLPKRGVYFFSQPDENRMDSGIGQRVVRVGTHGLKAGSKSKLSQRLRQHRGTSTGHGNHRGSIFRSLVGQALIASGAVSECRTWGIKSDAKRASVASGVTLDFLKETEREVEAAVSKHIGAMPILWVDVPDEPGPNSLRGIIERNSIALLSNDGKSVLDPPSNHWLGWHSNRDAVQSSGLWNQNHVTEDYDPRFLETFAKLVSR